MPTIDQQRRPEWWARCALPTLQISTCLGILAARCARGLQENLALLEYRGRREDRVRAAPAVSCAICTRKCAHEHTGSAETLRPSPRNGFTAYSVLFLVTGFLVTIASRASPQNLTPASGRQNHTISPYASVPFVKSTSASTASHRAFRDDREPPLLSGGTGDCTADLPDGLRGIFFATGLDRFWVICPTGCLAAPGRQDYACTRGDAFFSSGVNGSPGRHDAADGARACRGRVSKEGRESEGSLNPASRS